jgi:C4-type Zn-finger protein
MSVKLTPAPCCPVCRTALSGVMSLDDDPQRRPVIGDLTICVYCSAILEFKTLDTLIAVTGAALREALRDPDIRRAIEIAKRW